VVTRVRFINSNSSVFLRKMTNIQDKIEANLERKLTDGEVTALIQRAGELEGQSTNITGYEDLTLGAALEVIAETGVSIEKAHQAAYELLTRNSGGWSLYPKRDSSLRDPVREKARVLEERLIEIYRSVGLEGYQAEEDVPLEGEEGRAIHYKTDVDSDGMEVRVGIKGPHDNYEGDLFSISVEDSPREPKEIKRPKLHDKTWTPGWVAAFTFPITSVILQGILGLGSIFIKDLRQECFYIFHDMYVLPFKWAAYGPRKLAAKISPRISYWLSNNKPRVTIKDDEVQGVPLSVEKYIEGLVGNSDSNSYSKRRAALKNLRYAIEKDLVEARDFAEDLNID
jgi:hypothetical protein